MNARQTAQAQEIFGEALDLDAGDRQAFVLTACGEDEAVRQEVEALLASMKDAGRFLSAPTSAFDANPLIAASRTPSAVEATGTRIGNYKLVQLIGEGGFGSVFMAEQEQPVRRTVALKIIKLGMDTKQVIARFEAERQALAMMDHPNIAQVFEAGATDTGRPYFVMELVRGVPITVYCDEKKLSPAARMALFVDVCQAVQHAHQKGIIHRDLKPTNVLVTLHDDKPVPKVIDFGIAKATNARLTERTIFTECHQFIGTPQYMSPEQARFNETDIDTRSDVYSLGVLLYELLTGTTPFDARELRAAGYDQIGKIIREVEPPRPSTRLSTMGEALPAVAAQRSTEARRLSQLLRGELDWIVMKCLEKDRTRRYDAASDLCADVKRHLADEPVLARPTSAGYRLWKLARRHQRAVLAMSVALFGLIGGLAAASYGLVRATHDRGRLIIANANEIRQRQAAEAANAIAQIERASAVRHEASARTSAAKAEAINRFLEKLLASPRPENALGKAVLVRDVLDDAAVKIDNGDFKDHPEIEASIRQTLGRSYVALGAFSVAEAQLQKALAVARSAGGNESEPVVLILSDLAEAVGRGGDRAGAVKIARDVLELQLRITGEKSTLTADALEDLAEDLTFVDGNSEAESLTRRAMQIRRDLGEHDSAQLAFDLTLLGSVTEDEAGREQMLRKGLAMQRKLLGPDQPDLANTLHNLGALLADEKKWAEAKTALQESLAIKKKILPPGHPDFEATLTLLWEVLGQLQDWADLEPVLLDHYALMTKHHPDEPPINDMLALERTYAALGEAARAREWHENVQAGVTKKLASLTSQISRAPTDPKPLEARAYMEGRFGRFQQAADDFGRAIEIDPKNHQNYYYRGCLLAYLRDAVAYRQLCATIAGRFAESDDASILDRTAKTCLLLQGVTPVSEAADPLALANRALKLAGANDNPTWINLCRGMALYRRGDYAASIQSFESAMKPGDAFRHSTAQIFSAMAREHLGQTDRAVADLTAAKQEMNVRLLPAESIDIGEGNLENWLMYQVARREAEDLFAGSAR